MNYRFPSIFDSAKTLNTPMKYSIAFIIIVSPCQAYAAPQDMGTITVTSRSLANGTASGTYIAAGSGATGSFTLTRNNTRGYLNNIEIKPTGLPTTGTNGIEINNLADTNVSNDRFTYTFAITPSDNTAIHTIKIGQASYTTTGNSEVAQHTLNFTKSSLNSRAAQAIVRTNPNVPYYYQAMGDYFMAKRDPTNANHFIYNDPTSSFQLRENSGNKLYFYRMDFLNGTNQGGNVYRPSTTNGNVSVRNGATGFLPPTPTFLNIIKSTSTNPNNQTTFPPLTSNIVDGGKYISYGIENSASDYVVAVRNASTITLTYEGIMNGSNGLTGETVGETYNEWISFGVESEPLNYIFSGTVFNDNGDISDSAADAENVGAPYSSNNNYFNGIFDSNEAGVIVKTGSIASSVRLVNDCNNPTTTYATQTLTTADAGVYRFTIPVTEIGNRNSVCIIEDNNSDYPIRTTSGNKQVNFTSNQYSYPNNNFGRIIEANKALVLEKEQALNNCSISTLLPSTQNSLVYSKDSLVNVNPGQCIAYRIIATNRANLPISNFVMSDTLQMAGVNNATASSVLAVPSYNSDDYATDSVKVGKNDVPVKTKILSIAQKAQRVFYFNTKYGTTNSNP